MKNNQQKIWEKHVEGIDSETALNMYHNPAVFQKELVSFIDTLYTNDEERILEAGSEIGVTSFLLKSKNKYLLDLNNQAIEISKKLAEGIGEKDKCNFIVGDMFNTEFENNYFDVVFNAGVLEHFDQDEIVLALKEYKRICKKGGKIIIGLPNHYCKVYRSAYLLGIMMDRLGIKTWPYPKEYKYFDLKKSIEAAGLSLNRRFTLSQSSIFLWWAHPVYTPIRVVFKIINRIKPFEGYLTVLEIDNI